MASKVTPSIPGAPSLLLAISYAARRVSILQTWTYSPQNRQDGSAFALTYILRLRSCKSMDAFVISSLPSPMLETLQMAGPLRSADITPLHRYYGPSRYPGHAVQIEPGLWPQSPKNGSFSHFRRRLSSNSLRDCPKSDPGDRWLIRKSPPLAGGLSASIGDILSGSLTAWLEREDSNSRIPDRARSLREFSQIWEYRVCDCA